MKKIPQILICLILSAFATCTFATMTVSASSSNVSDPNNPFEGKINVVSYSYFNNKPQIFVNVVDKEKKQMVQIMFTDTDLPVGISLLNASGKPLVVSFSDTNHTIKEIYTYNPVNLSGANATLEQNNALKKQ